MSTHQTENLEPSYQSFTVRRAAGNIGAEIEGLRISGDLPQSVIDEIEQVLLTHRVVFFRGQDHLDDRTHQAFGARFGTTEAHPTVPSREGTRLFELDASKGGGRADSWHTDVTFKSHYPKICILRAVTVPAYGGDTVWANTVRAYEKLPPELKSLAEQLWAVHSNDYDYAKDRQELDKARLEHHKKVFISDLYEAEHPVVHVHPVTGERALLLGHFIKSLHNFSTTESARLFELLQNRVTRLDNTVRWQWQQHDVAMWDNRATQHYAVNDYGNQPRVVRRVTVQGGTATSIQGQTSRTRTAPQFSEPGQEDTRVQAGAAAASGRSQEPALA
ncbi:TauD/TfdA dioxygenase family protein [Advenella mimigardefordensis]|uniref:Putative taurine dioxygenase TauD n=1 Tax=Advenella mimigardefordensis (strain DSM 17166 / LMG 22922 / DPN7) TaxID=1247726 RepID=W0PEM1_ADVMD|nr:TauD/TfdA family dioxygenase [Advenella mimigardefordensis]AHG63513.1 putative taurine dioxygenase TauD [Advenella mimigardefordensis DPN7]